MNSASEHTTSLWMAERPVEAAPLLAGDERADVAVVGAGIAGMSAAYELARTGRSVIVLDAGPIGGGMTGRTTAHLSNAVDDRYDALIRVLGLDDARLAADSHTAAIARIEEIRQREDIACDFKRLDGYLFLAPGDDPAILDRELEASHRVGLGGVEKANRAPLEGFDTGPCLRFPEQGRFHPLKYLAGLHRCITRDGGRFVTGRAVKVTGGREAVVETASGRQIAAQAVVVATNSPVNLTTAIHTKQAPYRTYVIGARVPRGAVTDALYWDTPDPYHYVRLQAAEDGSHDVLIVGGEDHKTGQAGDFTERFVRLETWTRQRFPAVQGIAFRWSGQVMEPVDHAAFIGRSPMEQDNVFIATGDSGMGMTHGVIAGMLIRDLVLGRDNAWAKLYDPSRLTPGAVGEFAKENINVAAQYTDYVTGGDVASVDDIRPGEGAVVRRGLGKIAAWRDEQGMLHEHSAVCTHLGCIVTWNALERCWDCPCHGSQFSPKGEVLNGPACNPLGEAS